MRTTGSLRPEPLDPTDREAVTAFRHAADRTFLQTLGTPEEIATLSRLMAGDRLSRILDGGRTVATFRSFDTDLTLPGGSALPVNAVSAVTVAATHRRRGILTTMMRADLAAARDRGVAVSALFAAEAGIYARFGFGPATRSAPLTLASPRVRFREDAPVGGTVELHEPGEVGAELRAVQERTRRGRAGGLSRSRAWWQHTTRPGGFPAATRVVLHRDEDGEPDGYALSEGIPAWDHEVSNARMVVPQLLAATPEAYCGILETLASTDLVRSVELADRPLDDPLPWLLVDERAVTSGPVRDALWLRVLDAPAALSARSWWGTGEAVVEVVDETPEAFAAGTLRIAVEESGRDAEGWARAEVTPTTADPDVRLGADALAALLLGGSDVMTLAAAGRAGGTRSGLRRAALLFGTDREPWCDTHF
ncbi:GNAT family N-acetyltransferase [Kineococcus gynurae]|uniref:GNAT family N-acetyltransferase n=1 Tax=Kineococcus gynurae TaxID=452979 RepID=A0ABV5LQH5_9ACTN